MKDWVKKLLPSSVREVLFMTLTFCNVGVSTFFMVVGLYPEATFSSITSLLCFGMWVSEINKK